MKHMSRIASLSVTVFLLACTTVSTQDIQVDADVDPKVNFSGYKTYAWLATAQIMFDPEGQWEPRNVDIDAEAQLVINNELRKRNIKQVTNKPDMLVAYAAGIDMAALGLKQDPESKQKLLENIPKAALVITFIDAETGYVIWLAEAVGKVQQQANEATVRARIEYAISEMFQLLPKN